MHCAIRYIGCPRDYSKTKKIYIINFFICLVEFGLGYSGDNIGGIFGTQSGCNGYLNLFLIVVSAIYVTEYLEKR